MDTSLDFNSIVQSTPFTFLIGPKHTKLTIQSGLARHVSKPLDQLMNGSTRESKHRIAVLEDEDVDTFVAFCEFAYTGDYSVPEKVERMERAGSVSSLAPSYRSAGEVRLEEKGYEDVNAVEGEDRGGETANEEQPGEQEGTEYDEKVALTDQTQDTGTSTLDDTNVEPPADRPEDTEDNEFKDINEVPVPCNPKPAKKLTKRQKKKRGPPGVAPVDTFAFDLTPPSSPPQVPEGDTEFDATSATIVVENSDPTGKVPGGLTEDWNQPSPTWPKGHDAETALAETQDNAVKDQEIPKEVAVEEETIDTSFAKQHFCCPYVAGASLWDEFIALDYDDDHAVPEESIPNAQACSKTGFPDLPYLSFHAKVYVFATRYLIPVLAQLCLRKLHRELVNMPFPDPESNDQEKGFLTTAKARAVLELLHYTYSKTTRVEPISPTSATQLRNNELRKLVAHYAACKVKCLAEYCPPMESMLGSPSVRPVDGSQGEADCYLLNRSLRGLLDSTTELASDLVFRMMST